jgi:tetratricopeptide (TPR) repeat protein
MNSLCRHRGPAILAVGVAALAAALLFGALGRADAGRIGPSEVRALLASGDFAELSSDLVALDEAFRGGTASAWDLDRAYSAFRTSDPAVTARLDAWIAQDEKGYPARLAKGVQLNHLAVLARGSDIGTDPQGHALLKAFDLQKRTWQELGRALNPDGNKPVGLAEFIAGSIATGQERVAEQFFQRRLADGFDSALLYRSYARALEPWWSNSGASWEQSLERLRRFLDETRSKHGDDGDFAWLKGYDEYVAAEVARRRGDLPGAIAGFTQAIALGKQPQYYFARAITHIQNKEADRGLDDLNKTIEMDADYADAYSQIGGWLRLKGRFDEALAAYNRAVALDPLNPEYLCGRASVLVLLDRTDQARADVDNALTYGEFSPWVQTWRGFVYRRIDPQIAAEADRLAAQYSRKNVE